MHHKVSGPFAVANTLSDRDRKGLVLAIMVAVFLAAVDQTIVSTALPRITTELNGAALYAWVFTAYMVATTLFVPVAGSLGDYYGRRPVLLFSVLVFTVGSLWAGFANTMWQLIACRAVQGIGAGILTANAFALLGDVYPREQMAKVTGLMSAVYGLAGAVGPLLGGVMTDQLGWRWIFWINVPAGLLIACVLHQRLPKATALASVSVDVVGAVVFTAALLPALLALSWMGEGAGLTDDKVMMALGMALLCFVWFVRVERRASHPIIALKLFQQLQFSVAMLSMFAVALAMYAALLYAPLLFQQHMGMSATRSGVVTAPFVLVLSVTSVMAGRMISNGSGYRLPAALGVFIAACGMAWLSQLTQSAGPWLCTGAMMVVGAGLGFTMPSLMLAAQFAVGHEHLGITTGLAKFFRALGGLLGVVLAGAAIRYQEGQGLASGEAIASMMVLAASAMALTFVLTLLLSGRSVMHARA